MKNWFTLFAMVLSIGGLMAQPSRAIFFSEDGLPFQIVMNGVAQNQQPQASVTIANLNPVPYNIRVIFADQELGVLTDKVYMREGYEITYIIKRKKVSALEKKSKSVANTVSKDFLVKSEEEAAARKEEIENLNDRFVIKMQSATEIPGYFAQAPPPQPMQQQVVVQQAPPQQTTTVVTGGVSQTSAVQQTTTTTVVNPGGAVVGANVNVPGVSMNVNVGGVGGQAVYQETVTTTTTVSGGAPVPVQQQTVYVMPGYNGPVGCPWPMNNADFQNAKRSISSKTFEDSRMTMARQIIGSNCLTSAQVRELMELFTFEQTKLDFAKYCYGYTFDIGNYFVVNDAFTFESSIDDLNRYISAFRR
jgi:hypothetical protein